MVGHKKEKIDPFVTLCDKADNVGVHYTRDPYWLAVRAGCDAVREGNVTQEIIDQVQKEHRCWGPSTSNKKQLALLLEKLTA